jgi:hypothetical protein
MLQRESKRWKKEKKKLSLSLVIKDYVMKA